MLTSAGRSRRMSESTAFGVGSMMSISRLCVRISKCSRLSLYLWGERMTHTTFFSVGSGTGPTTVAPARVPLSTILRAEVSMTSWSYDLSRMRIFCPAMSDSLSCYGVLRDGSLEPFFALDAVRRTRGERHYSSVNSTDHHSQRHRAFLEAQRFVRGTGLS